MSTVRCNGCGNQVVEIVMEQGSSTFILQACSTCDRRRWQRDGEELPLTSVIAGISGTESEL